MAECKKGTSAMCVQYIHLKTGCTLAQGRQELRKLAEVLVVVEIAKGMYLPVFGHLEGLTV